MVCFPATKIEVSGVFAKPAIVGQTLYRYCCICSPEGVNNVIHWANFYKHGPSHGLVAHCLDFLSGTCNSLALV